jgi:rare lipoprotein A (peptidoglycan hydrolase)
MKKRGFIASLLSVILAAALFAQADPLNFVQTGTATHELESEDLVAAHAILPIGQEVLVTSLENGAQITVTITERINPSNSRIIDLSNAAAAAVAMFDDTTQVTIEATLKRNEPSAPAAPAVAATPAPAAAPAAPAQATPAQATTPAAPAPATPAQTTTPAAPAAAATPAPAAAPAAPAQATPAQATAPEASASAGAATPTTATEPAATASIVIPPPATGYTPTSEITPVVPPWETDYVPWPAPQNDPWLPELAQPWISGIEREQKSPRTFGPAQAPAPAFAPPPVSSAATPSVTPPPQEPARSGPSARVLPKAPGARDSALYRVQVGAFSARINAQEAFNRLLNAGFSPVFEVQGGLTRVQIPWVRGYEIQVISRRLYNAGFREVWVRAER